MKKYLLLLLLSILIPQVSWGLTNTAPSLSAEMSDAISGEIATLTVSLNNGDIVCNRYQFKLVLPTGVKLAHNEEGYVYELANRYTKKKNMKVQIEENEDGSYQLMCYSFSETLTGTDGPVIFIGLQIAPSVLPGDYEGLITDVFITNNDTGSSEQLGDASFNFTVTAGVSAASISAQTTGAYPGETATLTVSLNNGDIVCDGYQFKLVLPTGVKLAYDEEEEFVYELASRYSKKKDMEVVIEEYEDGTYQLMCFSLNGQTLTGSDGPIISLTLQIDPSISPGNYQGVITNAVISNYYTELSEQLEDAIFTISVISDPITITVKNCEREYGEENPTFEYTVEGGTINGTPSINCTATKTSPAGEYTISIEAGTIDYPNLILVNGTLNINKAPLTATAKSYTRTQVEPNPEFEITYTGFKNNETEAVLTKKPSATTEATADSEPGTYPIIISGGEAQNYVFNYINGTLTVTEAPAITISVKNGEREYGEENPTFEYTVEGGTINGTPSINCTATKTSPAGEYTISIEAGTIDYPNLILVNGTLNINKAPLTATAKSYTRTQVEPNPEFEITYTGFKNNETEAVLTKKPSATTEATADSEPGTYPIIISGGEAQNYVFNYINGTLTVTEAPAITISVKNGEREYGEENPTFEYTVEGGTINGTPSINCTATKTSPVGEYTISIEAGTVDYPNLILVNGTLTINKATLTATAKSYTIEQGQPNPEFEITYNGFKNGENETVLDKLPIASTTATSASEPGEYPITISGGEAQNYNFNYVEGTLIITPNVGICNTFSDMCPNQPLYNLQGVRVTTPRPGIFIQNGRKIVIHKR